MEVNPIGIEVLREKHQNGGVEKIHNQVFFELDKDKCPVCDLEAGEFFKAKWHSDKAMLQRMKLRHEIETTDINVEKLDYSRRMRQYNSKDAPPPIAVTCTTPGCGHVDMMQSHYFESRAREKSGPLPAVIDRSAYKCSSCWFEEYFANNDPATWKSPGPEYVKNGPTNIHRSLL